jgi:hypothetical protein
LKAIVAVRLLTGVAVGLTAVGCASDFCAATASNYNRVKSNACINGDGGPPACSPANNAWQLSCEQALKGCSAAEQTTLQEYPNCVAQVSLPSSDCSISSLNAYQAQTYSCRQTFEGNLAQLSPACAAGIGSLFADGGC